MSALRAEGAAMTRPLFRAALAAGLLVLTAALGASAADKAAPRLPAKAYAALPSFRHAKLSPDGTSLGYITYFKGRNILVLSNLDGSKPVPIPQAKGAEVRDFHWANDNRILVIYGFTLKRHGSTVKAEETRLYGVDRDGKNGRWLIKGKQYVESAVMPNIKHLPVAQLQDDIIDMLPDDPDHILLALDAEQQGNYEVWQVDVNTGNYKVVRKSSYGVQNWYVDQHHVLRFGTGYGRSNRTALLLDAHDNWIPLLKTDWFDSVSIAGFSDDPNIIYVLKTSQYGTRGVYKLALDSGSIVGTVFENKDVDADGVVTNPETGQPAGVAYTVDMPHIDYFDPKLAHIQAIVDKALKTTDNRIIGKARGKDIYMIYAHSDTSPGTYYYLDLDSKELRILADYMDGIAPQTQAHVKPVTIPVRDGSSIPGYLTLPKGHEADKGLKAVILPHGGPEDRDTADWNYMAQFLANRGYAVLQPNFRGSTGYGVAFERAGIKQWGGRMQDDITDATKWLIKEHYADKDHVCIAGGSFGGYAALMGAVKEPGLYKCAVSINGVTDIPAMKNYDRHFIGGRVWIKDMGLEGKSASDVSPIDRADEIKIPVLLISAKNDPRVDYRQSKYMAKALKHAGIKAHYVMLKDGGHTLDTAAARETVLSEMEKFLKANLGR